MSLQRLILVDDSEPVQKLVRARLAGEPVEILCASDGATGLRLIREATPDLVLLDAEMPGMDGFEVCRALKSDAATMHIPVILLTGATSSEQKLKGLELGAIDYVTKPFEPAELRARVRAGLRLKFLLDLLHRKAQIDGLTGLWNRRYFDGRLEEMQALAMRSGHSLSCILVDLDHFKSINDRYGHPIGDELLREIANSLNSVIRAEDVLCRFGGEEFVLLLPNTAMAGAAAMAERLREHVAGTRVAHRGGIVSVTASFGVAAFDALETARMLDRAEQAINRAKGAGRNNVVADDLLGHAAV